MISFYFKETLKIFKRSLFATVVTITITTIAILLCSFSLFLVLLSQSFSDRITDNIEVNAYISDSLDLTEVFNIKSKLVNNSFISSVEYFSKDQAAVEFIKETGEDFRTVLDENPLPQSFVIKFKSENINESNFDKLVLNISEIPGITEVIYDYAVIVKILKYFRSAKIIIYLMSGLLLILSIYLVYTYNKIQFDNNKQLYQTMKLVGAKLGSLKIPIILNGMIIGLISSILSYLIINVSLVLLTAIIGNLNFSKLITVIHLLTLSLGIVLGLVGSYLASRSVSLNISSEK